MKFNLKNRPRRKKQPDGSLQGWIGRENEPDAWFEGFEKELHEMQVEYNKLGQFCKTIKEILGET